MIRIQITNPSVREFKGVSTKSGSPKPYHMRFQTAYAFTINAETGEVADFPDKFEINLDADQQPYPRGVYQLQPSSLYVSREGRLELSPRLVPVPAAKA